jgi:hypothetical protein
MDAIPPPVQSLLDLFATSLAEVRFGDVDAKTLASAAADVQAAAAIVTGAQSALDEARRTLHELEEALLQNAHRAAAYARVYAENDAALSERVSAIALPRPTRRARHGEALVLSAEGGEAGEGGTGAGTPARRPRGRPRKVTPVAPELDTLLLTGK